MKICKFLIGFGFLFIGSVAMAESSDNSITYFATFSNLSVDDPSGSTESTSEFSPYNIEWRSKLSKSTRYTAGIHYADFKLNASTTNIGQEVTQLTFSASYQKKFAISRSIHPFLGVGFSYSQLDVIARHKVDNSGFLSTTYPDRTEDIFSVNLSADFEYELNKSLDVGFKLLHRQPLGDGVKDSSFGIAIVYKL